MSAGRSSQVAACFSVERTKYLMLSKSIPDRAQPRWGLGFLSERGRRLAPPLEHPLRLALLRRDVAHHGLGEPALRARTGDVGVGPAVAVSRQGVDVLVLGHDTFGRGGHICCLPA